MSDNRFEILSPAGSFDTLVCAISNGADAVYIGGRNFSARKNAANFTTEEISSAVKFAHLHGAKVYVTVNTLIGDAELSEVYEFVEFLYNAGVDALIIQDMGVLDIVKRYFPDFEVHASTQMTIHNIEGARLAKELGFTRVVLSRELTFKEIKAIHESVDIELEVFVHGALCMSYSGQCLMSSFIGGRSGNRGACAQPCRLPYTLLSEDGKPLSGKDKYLLSLKDLCLIDEMDTLASCGVTSLKIEGRMKSSDYVSIVTSIYNKYRSGGKVSDEDAFALRNIFSRSGFTKGYLTGDTGRHMLNYDKNNDDVYSVVTDKVKSLGEELKQKKAPDVKFGAHVTAKKGQPMTLEAKAMGKTVRVCGTVLCEDALKVPLTEERIISQISKTGSTDFEVRKITVDIDEGISLPVKEINELRRMALERLRDALSEIPRQGKTGIFEPYTFKPIEDKKIIFNAQVMNMSQAVAAFDAGFDRVTVPLKLYTENRDFFSGKNVAVILPPIMRDCNMYDMSVLPDMIYATNISQLGLCKGHSVCADFRMNVFNSSSAKKICDMGAGSACLSAELNLTQINKMQLPFDGEIVVYGRVPLMTLQNCPVKSAVGKCSCQDGDVYMLKDRKGVKFPLFTCKHEGVSVLYNATPIYMADRLGEIKSEYIKTYRFIFTTERAEDIKKLYVKYKNPDKSDEDFTRGHYYRGV